MSQGRGWKIWKVSKKRTGSHFLLICHRNRKFGGTNPDISRPEARPCTVTMLAPVPSVLRPSLDKVWSFSQSSWITYVKMHLDILKCTQSVLHKINEALYILCKYSAEASFVLLGSGRVAALRFLPDHSSDKRPTVSPMGSPHSSAIRLKASGRQPTVTGRGTGTQQLARERFER